MHVSWFSCVCAEVGAPIISIVSKYSLKTNDTHSSMYFDERPQGVAIDTVVLHAICAADCENSYDAAECFRVLQENKVSTHYLIDRAGNIFSLVAEDKRAWHAGLSRLPFEGDHRENLNHFSIGIELIGRESEAFSEQQYPALAGLIRDICGRHTISYILGHEHVAPGRKSDPGQSFDWNRLRSLLQSAVSSRKLIVGL